MGDVSVRDFMLRAVDELATGYDTQGVELDFAAAPGGTGHWFPPDKAAALGPEMTDWLRRASDAVHNRAQDQGLLGARVYPTAAANHKAGLEVERWLEEGLVDYLVPMVYGFMIIDGAMPIDWLIELAHDHDSSVYAMLQPYYEGNHRPGAPQTHASPAMFRAAAANAWQAGVDGLYTWFLAWPLGESERAVLTELSDPAQVAEKDKHYFLRRTCDLSYVVDVDYPAHLPLTMDPAQDLGRGFEVPVVIADDIAGNDRIARICLRLALTDLTCADRLDVQVNGQSLEEERMQRRPSGAIVPYEGMWLEYDIVGAHPLRQGLNRLQLTLQERPPGLCSKVVLEDVEVIVEYGQWA